MKSPNFQQYQNKDSICIRRCPHDRNNPFTQISNELIRDKRLHPITYAILSYLLSQPDNWKISVKQLISHFKGHDLCGKNMIYKYINQAIELGYLKRNETYVKGLKKTSYTVSEKSELKKCLRRPAVRDAVRGDAYKRTKNTKKESISNDIPKKVAEPAPHEKKSTTLIKREDHVFTSEEEHNILKLYYGESDTAEAYRVLRDWKLRKPKSHWKKDDYHSILRWVMEAIKEKKFSKIRRQERSSPYTNNTQKTGVLTTWGNSASAIRI